MIILVTGASGFIGNFCWLLCGMLAMRRGGGSYALRESRVTRSRKVKIFVKKVCLTNRFNVGLSHK
jgi:nucleoside-diphosphate-sugar epimerase